MILELQKRGLILDYSDAINQAISFLRQSTRKGSLGQAKRGWQIGKEPSSG